MIGERQTRAFSICPGHLHSPTMQRVSAAALLVCLILSLGGFYPIQRSIRLHVKRAVRARLRTRPNEMDVATFTFHVKNGQVQDPHFTWVEEDEFDLGGVLYDVLDRTVEGDLLTVYAIADGKEMSFLARFAAIADQANEQDPHRSFLLAQLLALCYLPPPEMGDEVGPIMRDQQFARGPNAYPMDGLLVPVAPPPRAMAA